MIAANMLNLLALVAQKNSKNGFLMDISETLRRMQDAAANALQLLQNQQDIENQQIELDMEALDESADDYTQKYQELLTEQQKLTQKQTREAQRLQDEWDRKERPYELLQEQVETEVEAIDADIDGMRDITKENAQTEFGMLQS